MENASVLYTKEQKRLLYGRLRGELPDGTICPKVNQYSTKIRELLLLKKVDYKTAYIRQVLWWKTDNDNVWNTVVELIENENKALSGRIEKRDRVLNLV